MKKVKTFLTKFIQNKKIFIPVIAIFLVVLAAVICFASMSGTNNNQVTSVPSSSENIETTSSAASQKEDGRDNKKQDSEEKKEDTSNASQKDKEESKSDSSADTASDTASSGGTGSDSGSSPANIDSGSLSSSSANTPTHTHTWKAHTAERWVPNIVTVVDQPEQTTTYDIYRMYWYDTGTWEETRDPNRFQEWYHSENGGLYVLYHPFANPEDNPLFQGYDENGHATYTGDHVIIGPYYETIPAVTHEEDHGHNETYVDYYYCDCGARK